MVRTAAVPAAAMVPLDPTELVAGMLSPRAQLLLAVIAAIGILHAGLFWGFFGLLAAIRWGMLS